MKSTRVIKFSVLFTLTGLLLLTAFSVIALGRAESSQFNIVEPITVRPAALLGTLPNGVAAGDVTQTSATLWTRGTVVGDMVFEISTDATLNTGIFSETATVTTVMQPVKVTLNGLTAGTTYYYRATDAATASATGQFRTAAALGSQTGLRFGVAGDWDGALAPYPAISNVPSRNLDFFVAHGDTIVPGTASSLADFRAKHDEVYGTHQGLNRWADLRGSTAIFATIDDNEVRNDFAGGLSPALDNRFDNTGNYINETNLYHNALTAFTEYNPIINVSYGATGDPVTANKQTLYRYRTYGDDAAVFILDTRSFRDGQLDVGSTVISATQFLGDSLSQTSRTIFGAQQFNDLKADLLQAQAAGLTWKFVMVPDPIQNLGLFKAEDRFEGYAAERNALLRFIDQNDIENVVFIAAGLHGTVVNNLTYQDSYPGPQIPTTAFEVIAGPVAIDPPAGPFGPVLIDYAELAGFITPTMVAAYEGLPRAQKDDFARTLMDDELITPLGYDSIGLAGSAVQATLLQGGYVAAHTYGWTEFEIHPVSQVLTVTVYGIDYYTELLLNSNPSAVINRTPAIISQFVVQPGPAITPPSSVTLAGPILGNPNQSYFFDASVSPLDITQPITYQWQVTDQAQRSQSGDLDDSQSFSWATPGLKQIMVTAQNGSTSVNTSHTIEIQAAPTGAANSLTRSLEPVVVRGSQVSELRNTPVDQLFVYVYQSNAWNGQIPFQLDEVQGGAYVATENNALDNDDEIVFMAQDLGDRAPSPLNLLNILPIGSAFYEIEVVDPLNTNQKGWAYIVSSTTLSPSFSGDYVAYASGANRFTGDLYTLDLADDHVGLRNVTIGGSSDLLDRTKLRMTVDGGLFGLITVTEERIGAPTGSEPVLIKDGPIRAIVQRSITFNDDGVDVDLGATYIGYEALVEGRANLKMDVPGFNVTNVQTTLDYNSNATGSTFYNANVIGGVTVDGNPDAGATTILSEWAQLSHANGRIIQVSDPTDLGDNPTTIYADDSTTDSSDTGDKRAYGESGFEVTSGIKLNTTLYNNWYFLPPASSGPDNVGDTYKQYYFNPLNISSRLVAAIDDVTIVGATTGMTETIYVYIAQIDPVEATAPITYQWSATDQPVLVQLNDNQVNYLWTTLGQKTITVTVYNGIAPVTDVHVVDIQAVTAPSGVTISGPNNLSINNAATFSATVSPLQATTPLTYIWQATDQSDVVQTNTLNDQVSFTWNTGGNKTVSVSVMNRAGTVVDTHQVNVVVIPLASVTISGPDQGFITESNTFVATVSPLEATQPITYLWQATDQPDQTQVDGSTNTVSYSWSTTGLKTVTVSAMNRAGSVIDSHTFNVAIRPLAGVAVSGPDEAELGQTITLNALASPSDTTGPITYTWQASEQPPIIHTGGLQDIANFFWLTFGTKTVTVTATREDVSVSDVHTLVITQGASLKTLDRTHDAIIIPGADLSGFSGRPINQLFVYSYTLTGWGSQIPVQIDEIEASGTYTHTEDGLLDDNDQLVMMAAHIGHKAPAPLSLMKSLPIGSQLYEIEVTDPLDSNKKGWAYLVHSTQLASTISDAIDFNPATNHLTSSRYDLEFADSHTGLSDLILNESAIDLLDRTKLRLVGDAGILGVVTITEERIGNPIGSEPRLIKDGPVRDIVERAIVFDDDGVQVNLSTRYFAYAQSIQGFASLALDVPVLDITSVRTSLDFSSNASGGTFFNQNVPGGVPVDGSPDSGVASALSNWSQLSHSTGRLIQVTDPTTLGLNPTTYYKDDSTLDDSDTGDEQSYADTGFVVTDNINLNSLLRSAFYMLPPASGSGADNVGATFEAAFFNPLTSQATLLTAVDSVAVTGSNNGLTEVMYTFRASVAPPQATTPVSYTWTITDYDQAITQVAGTETTLSINWQTPGVKNVSIAASNGGLVTVATHAINIADSTVLVPLSGITISGATSGVPNTAYAFRATYLPSNATPPTTYIWQATDQAEVSQSGDLVAFSWLTPGQKTVTVIAINAVSRVTDTVTINIVPAGTIPVDTISVTGPLAGTTNQVYTFTTQVGPANATTPVAYVWRATDQGDKGGLSDLTDNQSYSWASAGPKIVTVVALGGGQSVTGTLTINIDAPVEPADINYYLPLLHKP